MVKRIFLLIILLLIIYGGWILFKNQVGDIRPAILPPLQTPKSEERQADKPFDTPIRIGADQRVKVLASGLGSVRDLEISPGGTAVASIPSSGRVVGLKEGNVKNLLTGLNRPHGLAFFDGKLFVALETRVVRYFWDENNLAAKEDRVLFDLPKGGNHVTRTIAFDKDGQMFVSIGSTCDVCIEKHPFLASVIVSDQDGNNPRVFSRGLRNSVFITINPKTGELWGTEMGRDFLGDNLPPDEINIIRDGKDYGWPLCFGNKVRDSKFGAGSQARPCEATEAPIYEIAAHSAPLGLAFHEDNLYVAYHGSWNRSTPIGYKVVRFKVSGNSISDERDFIIDFLQDSQVIGRPVDIIFDKDGNIYVSDDKAGVVYKVDLQ